MDNALDACEEHGIPPHIKVVVEKKGPGSLRNTDQIMIRVEDNGPGIALADIPKVFGGLARALLAGAAGYWYFRGHHLGHANDSHRCPHNQ